MNDSGNTSVLPSKRRLTPYALVLGLLIFAVLCVTAMGLWLAASFSDLSKDVNSLPSSITASLQDDPEKAASPFPKIDRSDLQRIGSTGHLFFVRHGARVHGLDHARAYDLLTTAGVETPSASGEGWCLSGQGRDQAKVLGAAFQQLGILVDRVATSPLCRNLETADLAFGGGEIFPNLSFIGIHHGDDEMKGQAVQQARGEILSLLNDSRKGNIVVVGHGNYLERLDLGLPENLGDYFNESDTLVLMRDAGSVKILGHMTLMDWADLNLRERAAK